jgi:hypothetical protein
MISNRKSGNYKMDRNNIDTCFEILEINPDASLKEIKSAYFHLKKLYSEGSIATQPVSDEFYDLNNETILKEIENAYTRIISYLKTEISEDMADKNVIVNLDTREKKSDSPCFDGNALKKIRETLGINLCEIASYTKIRILYLENIENEKFEELISEVFLKGYLRAIAEYLKLDSEKVVNDYMTKYRLWREGKSA